MAQTFLLKRVRPAQISAGSSLFTFFGSFVLCALVLVVGAALVPSDGWAVASLITFLIFCGLLTRAAPFSFVMLSPLLAMRITEFIGGVAIESGAYMIEAQRHGDATGAFARLLLIDLLALSVIVAGLQWAWPALQTSIMSHAQTWRARLPTVRVAVIAAIVCCSLVVVYFGVTYGFPLLEGEDRFHFLWRVDSPIFKAFILNRALLTPLFGLLLLDRRSVGLAWLAQSWLILVSLLFGEKFTSLVVLSLDFFIPYGVFYVARGGQIPLKFVGLTAVALTVLTVPAVLVAYGGIDNLGNAAQKFADRATLQGQLWFLADHQYPSIFFLDTQAITADIRSWFSISQQDASLVGTKFGLYYVMTDYTHAKTLRYIIESGNGFVFSQQAYLLKATGYFGLITMMAIVGLFHACVSIMIVRAIFQVNIIAVLAMARVNSFLMGFYFTGFFWNLFGLKTIATMVVAGIALYVHRYRAKSRTFIPVRHPRTTVQVGS